MQHAGGERQPLLPAAGQMRGKLLGVFGKLHAHDDLANGIARIRHFIDAGHQLEILTNGEILVIAEALRHVPDLPANRGCVAHDVEAEAGARAGIRLEQAAQHADGRGLATAVGAEESAYLALRDLQPQVFHDTPRTKALGKIVNVDDVIGHNAIISTRLMNARRGLSSAARSPAARD
jgi:hypothetical protein